MPVLLFQPSAGFKETQHEETNTVFFFVTECSDAKLVVIAITQVIRAIVVSSLIFYFCNNINPKM